MDAPHQYGGGAKTTNHGDSNQAGGTYHDVVGQPIRERAESLLQGGVVGIHFLPVGETTRTQR